MTPPFVLGLEFAGVVVASSSPPCAFERGARVYGFGRGTYAEEVWVGEEQVRRVPRGWTNGAACAVGPSAAVSYGALVQAGRLGRGESVLVLGASGGLGVAAVQVARALGAGRVIGLVGEERGEKADVVRRLGAEVVGYRTPGWEKRVVAMTGGEGVDVIYDSVGDVESCLRCVNRGGRIVVVGFAGRGGKMEQVRVNKILLTSSSVVGYRFGEQSRQEPKKMEQIQEAVTKLMESSSIVPVVYSEVYQGLESLPRAMEDVMARKVWGRAVISVSDEDTLGVAGDETKTTSAKL